MDKVRKDRHKPGYINRYHAENYYQFYLRVRKDSGIMDALRKMQDATGDSVNGYIAESVRQKLVADGFMSD